MTAMTALLTPGDRTAAETVTVSTTRHAARAHQTGSLLRRRIGRSDHRASSIYRLRATGQRAVGKPCGAPCRIGHEWLDLDPDEPLGRTARWSDACPSGTREPGSS